MIQGTEETIRIAMVELNGEFLGELCITCVDGKKSSVEFMRVPGELFPKESPTGPPPYPPGA
jgi:hypothetical protein